MDPLTVAAGVSAVAATAGLGSGLRLRRRLRRAEVAAGQLRRELHAERHAANHDSLTGLPNRRAFHQLGSRLVTATDRPAVACVVVDLDSLKQVNDTLGHSAGDQVLVTAAGRLATYAGDDLVARLGGDEFAGLFTDPSAGWQLLYPAADRLAELLAEPMWVAGRALRVSASVGVAPVQPGTGLTLALHHADCAMYRAKATGTGVACFTPSLDADPADHAVTAVLPAVTGPAPDQRRSPGRAVPTTDGGAGGGARRLVETASQSPAGDEAGR